MRSRWAVLLTGALLLAFGGTAGAQEPATARQDTWNARQAGLTVLAQDAGRGGRGVTVAVLDTWVDVSHPDFEGRAQSGADCVAGLCRAGQTRDACDHGTHVAGTVASSSYGAAPEATVLPIRVLRFDEASDECIGEPEDVAAGIRYALARGARVINLSLGADTTGTDDGPLAEAVGAAAAAGAVVVLSAGNGAVPVADGYGSEALVVAATTANGSLPAYSQRGGGVDLAAPGGDAVDGTCSESTCVTSLFPSGGYAVAAGTSMSAPMVSGVAALLLAQRPSRSGGDVTELLLGTTRSSDGGGAGLLDASAALGVTPTVPRPAATPVPPAGVVPLALVPPQTQRGPAPPGASLPPSSPQLRPDPVSLGPVTTVQNDLDPVPLGLGVGALLLILAAGTATVLVRRTL